MVMNFRVFALCNDLKVFYSIVLLVQINMMDNLISFKRSAKRFFYDSSMFFLRFAVNRYKSVASLVDTTTFIRWVDFPRWVNVLSWFTELLNKPRNLAPRLVCFLGYRADGKTAIVKLNNFVSVFFLRLFNFSVSKSLGLKCSTVSAGLFNNLPYSSRSNVAYLGNLLARSTFFVKPQYIFVSHKVIVADWLSLVKRDNVLLKDHITIDRMIQMLDMIQSGQQYEY